MASLADGRSPRVWIEEKEAIVNAARYLGFMRTGENIRQAFKSAIRALIRSGELERNRDRIRKA
jgi:hypothetical protein